MTKDETVRLLDWLTNIYPRQYSPNMTQRRREDLLDAFYEAFTRYGLADIMAACKEILKEDDDAPTVKSIMSLIRAKKNDARSGSKPPVNLDGLPDDHPYRGCYYHEEALEAYMEDMKTGNLSGRRFRDYCKMYPETKWRPWSSIELNRDRLEGGEWSYVMTRGFRGWTVNEHGFCVPK